MAEKIGTATFTALLNRFYKIATKILLKSDAWLDKLVGDEVMALFIPGFVGSHHANAVL
ncbi:hypothetical protein ACFLZR_00340 [Candidatus Neomarinimicrobiota bacterium]